ncbi:MAG: hypothetical protein EP330_06900 [Deltaproteobacteria bacterium]|nr:MAG: hypothetical protein EP330_06900 [Deltaproteobacteria bacterium]
MRSLSLLLLLACTGDPAVPEVPENATDAVWGEPFVGSEAGVPFWPDTNAVYWRYAFDAPSRNQAIRLTGVLDDARYIGFDCYDDEARTPVDNVRDSALVFDDGAPWDGGGGHFTLWLVDEAATAPGEHDNVCVMPAGIPRWSVFMRQYLSEAAPERASLPYIDQLDLPDGASEAPPEASAPVSVPQGLLEAFVADAVVPERDEVYFYRLVSDGTYPTRDNQYLIAQVERGAGDVLVLSWTAPAHAEGPAGSAPVRYWSLSQGDWSTYTYRTDHDASLGDEGVVTVAIGDPESEAAATARGHRFVPWSAPDRAWFLYRNMVETLSPAFTDVPAYDFDQPPDGQEARLVLGDRAPHGVLCTAASYADGSCG